MKRVFGKRLIAALLVFCCLFLTTVYADVTQEDIDNAKDKIEDLQDQKENAENAVNDYKDKKEELEGNLKDLNGKLQTIVNEMNEIETQIGKKQKEIESAEQALAAAEAQCEKQYEDMKLRIKFMYENGDESPLVMLLESDSMSDFLNRTEYVTSIHNYDRAKLKEFQQLQADIEAQKKQLEEEEVVLLGLKDNMKAKQSNVNQLISQTRDNISKTDANLADAKENVENLADEIKKWEQYEKELEIQKAKEDLARLEEIKKMENEDWSNVVYVPAEGDLYLLGAIIQCESDGEPYVGKLAVGSVVMNRVKSSKFPNTVSGVIYQRGQFSPVASGRFAYRLQHGVNQTCLNAAAEVLNGNITNKCLFFRTNNGIVQGQVIGNHVFY